MQGRARAAKRTSTEAGGRVREAASSRDGAGWEVWRADVSVALAKVSTPCLVFSAARLDEQLEQLDTAFAGLPVRHWWSFKTLPLRRALEAWKRRDRPVEVVSEFELRAVLDAGFAADRILVNGPAKHAWLGRWPVRGLRVNFDSVTEIRALGGMAKRLDWQVGVRLSMPAEDNHEYPGVRAAFGLMEGEEAAAARWLRRTGLEVGVIHFHLRTNVPEPRYYGEAIDEAWRRAVGVGWRAGVLDIGGGFPPARVASRKGAPVASGFSLAAMRAVVAGAVRRHGLREVWMENGRWLTAPMAVLAVRVLEAKEGRGARVLVCDGGRTLQAMVATWERHGLVPLRPRRGLAVATMVYGPTCMAFDNLGIHALPRSVGMGEVLLWQDAGAYQLAWETRFSHGLAAVAWVEGGEVAVARAAEAYEDWWRTR